MAPKKNKDHFEFTDAEKSSIISEVQARESLWNTNDDNHSKRDVAKAHFDSIARYMSTENRKVTGNCI